jgi:CheY-like chemotaxis protein
MLKQSLDRLQLIPQSIFCNNGQQAIDSFKEIVFSVVKKVARTHAGKEVTLKPVALMLLDLQMPMRNGIEVVNWIKTSCRIIAATHAGIKIELPTFIIQTAYFTNSLRQHLAIIGVAKHYEKPMRHEQIVESLELAKITRL